MIYNSTILCDATNHGKSRKASSIKYIVVHYTGNKTDTARTNALYFHNRKNLKASAHYFVDDVSIYQSVPDLVTAYSVGGKKLNDDGIMHGTITNNNSISIELCSVNGRITDATINNAIALIIDLVMLYRLDGIKNVVYRHMDVTGKPCPAWTLNTLESWFDFVAKTEKAFESTMKYLENFKWF